MTVFIALDPGKARVGVAVSDPTGTLARPLKTISRKPHRAFLHSLMELVQAHKPERLVLGLPLELDGRKGRAAQAALSLAFELEGALGLPVSTVDERFTTLEAEECLREIHPRSRERCEVLVDQTAAAIILERYLRTLSPGPESI